MTAPAHARDPEELLTGLNPEQRDAVTSEASPLRILAGAGSGKTRVLTRRIAHRALSGAVDPRHVLALTFTRKAAAELNTRLRALGLRDAVAAGTFHGIAYAQLRARWEERGTRAPSLLQRKVGFVTRLIPRRAEALTPLDLVGEIEWAKARGLTPESYPAAAAAAGRRTSVPTDVVADLFERYEQEKSDRRMVDFDDLLGLCQRALRADPEFAAAQRWRFRHLFVDEFQDVNPLQFSLLQAWLGDRRDLCVVGDPNQAIYAWNGADAGYLVDFAQHFPGAASIELRRNYRSTPEVLAAAGAVLSGGRLGGALVAERPAGPPPRVRRYRDDREEAAGIARAIRDARAPGGRWSDQAVLVRTNAQLPAIEDALRRAGIPHRTRGASLLAAPEVAAVLRRLERDRSPLPAALTDLEQALRGVPDDDVGEAPADAERRANLETLIRLGYDHLSLDPEATGSSFAQWLRTTIGADDVGGGDAVDLTTFHAAKGLEWSVVHLAGLEHGLVPIAHARTPDAHDEEQRLLYVAITRAERLLSCSWAQQRTFGSRARSRTPSPWLERIESAIEGAPGGQRRSGRSRAARERERLGTAGAPRRSTRRRDPAAGELDPDDPLLAALRSWRTTTARAADVPAYVVFADATLEAVAARRPRSRSELLALPGLGPVKTQRYGDALLQLVAEHPPR